MDGRAYRLLTRRLGDGINLIVAVVRTEPAGGETMAHRTLKGGKKNKSPHQRAEGPTVREGGRKAERDRATQARIEEQRRRRAEQMRPIARLQSEIAHLEARVGCYLSSDPGKAALWQAKLEEVRNQVEQVKRNLKYPQRELEALLW